MKHTDPPSHTNMYAQVNALIQHNAPVDAKTNKGNTPLLFASGNGHVDCKFARALSFALSLSLLFSRACLYSFSLSFARPRFPSLSLAFPRTSSLFLALPRSPSLTLARPRSPSLSLALPHSPSLSLSLLRSFALTLPHTPSLENARSSLCHPASFVSLSLFFPFSFSISLGLFVRSLY